MTPQAWETWIRELYDPCNHVTVELCRFTATYPRWRITPRVLKEHLVYLMVKNQLQTTVEDVPIKLSPGDCLWLDPGVRHTMCNADRKEPASFFHIRFRLLRQERDILAGPRPWLIGHSEPLELTFEDMLREYRQEEPFAPLRFRLMLTSMFVLLARQSLPSATKRRVLSNAQREALVECARQHGFQVNPMQLAAEVRLNLAYFRYLFSNTYGIPLKTWLTRRRVAKAATMLLESSISIGEVAERNGYPDVFQFSKQFKAVMGVSPRAYRDTAGSHPDKVT